MSRSRRLAGSALALAVALGGSAVAATSAHAADAPVTFQSVGTRGAWVSRIVSPTTGVLRAVGIDGGSLRVDTYAEGAWSTRTLAVDVAGLASADAAAADGVTWVLAAQPPYGTPASPAGALFRISADGTTTRVPLPTYAGAKSYVPARLAASGSSVAVIGTIKTAEASYLGLNVAAVHENGAWRTTVPLSEDQKVLTNDQPPALVDGHLLELVSQYGQHAFSRVMDLTTEPATEIGPFYSLVGSTWNMPNAFTVTSPTQVTAWGRRSVDGVVTGLCTIVTAGSASDCPAPELDVHAAVRLADGRTLLSGDPLGTSTASVMTTNGNGFVAGVGPAAEQLTTDPARTEAWSLDVQADGTKAIGHVIVGGATPTPTTPTPTKTPKPPKPTKTATADVGA